VNDITLQARPAPMKVQSEAQSLLSIIADAARDPSVDVTKMRELLAMRRELADEQSRQEFDLAMNEVQAAMEPVRKDANNPQTKSKYASYGALDVVLRPIYTSKGFSLQFNTADGAPADYVRVVCDVSRSGHTRRYQIDMPADGKGAKGGDVMTKTHAVGSASTYGRRYLLTMIFNIVTGDDDGNGAAKPATGPVSSKQAEELHRLINDFDLEKPFKKFFKVQAVEELPASQFERAVYELNNIGAAQRGVKK